MSGNLSDSYYHLEPETLPQCIGFLHKLLLDMKLENYQSYLLWSQSLRAGILLYIGRNNNIVDTVKVNCQASSPDINLVQVEIKIQPNIAINGSNE